MQVEHAAADDGLDSGPRTSDEVRADVSLRDEIAALEDDDLLLEASSWRPISPELVTSDQRPAGAGTASEPTWPGEDDEADRYGSNRRPQATANTGLVTTRDQVTRQRELNRSATEPDPGVPDRVKAAGAVLLRLGRAHAGALAVLLVVALVLTGSRLMAARGHEIAASATVTPTLTPAAEESPSAEPVPLHIHVMGAVSAPGVVTVPQGARVADAIQAAGGLTEDADCAELNLADELPDGAQILIGTTAEPRGEVRTGQDGAEGAGTASDGSGGTDGSGSSGTAINLNTASVAELETLPGVGPVMAQRIADWRAANGDFTRVEELQEVDGIGAKTYARLAPLVTV